MTLIANRSLMAILALSAALTLTAALGTAQATQDEALTWPEDTLLILDGPGIELVIRAGSQATSLSSTASTFTVTVPADGSFTIEYPKPQPGSLSNDGGLPWCVYSGGNNIITVIGPKTVTFYPSETPKCTAAVKTDTLTDDTSGDSYVIPTVTLAQPDGGERLTGNSVYSVTWSVSGSDIEKMRVLLSRDGGLTFMESIAELETVAATFDWTVPNIDEDNAKIMVEALNGSGRVMASDLSKRTFSITAVPEPEPPEGTTEEPPEGTTPDEATTGSASSASEPEDDPTTEGLYDPEEAMASTLSIDTDLDLVLIEDGAGLCAAGGLIKTRHDKAVYYCGRDGKRYVFPNQKVYLSWFQDFDKVTEMDEETMAQIAPGGMVTYRPGTRLVKTQAEPQTYAISRGGTLRWVESESVAELLYGEGWSGYVDDIDPAFFSSYKIGKPIGDKDVKKKDK